jgi:abortive infection bacteriophage resistance protein
VNVKKQHQLPLDLDGQIENLRSINLVIEDENRAKELLNDISYFRLIKAFGLGLKPKNGCFPAGVTFDRIVELYLFNCNFRQMLFPLIERIEINLRCRIANRFSSEYGCLGYESPDNFGNPQKHVALLNDIRREIQYNSRSPFVKNFQENYEDGKIPFYALVELFSFGTLSKFFKNLKNQDKKFIARSFGVGYTYFESWIESLAYIRNICAHYGRLYNSRLVKTPQLYATVNEKRGSEGKAKIGNNRVFVTLLCMKYILDSATPLWMEFVNELDALLCKYPHVEKEQIGFPDDWRSVLLEA